MWETQVWSPGQEDPLDEEMATYSSIEVDLSADSLHILGLHIWSTSKLPGYLLRKYWVSPWTSCQLAHMPEVQTESLLVEAATIYIQNSILSCTSC